MSKTKYNSRKIILMRAYVVFALLSVFCGTIFYTAIKLNFGKGKELSKQLSAKNTRIINIDALRGNIYAGDGSLLATSVPKYTMVMDILADGLTPLLFKEKIDSFSMVISQMFPEKNKIEWKNHFIKQRALKYRYLIIAKDLNYGKVEEMKKWPLVRLGKYGGGVWFNEEYKRMYFMSDLAKRSIGYVKDKTSVGLEGAFDSLLRGKNGTQMQQQMTGKGWRPIKLNSNLTAINGKDIVTTLDIDIQDIAQYSLQKGLEAEKADHGCVIVMETATGAIKAIANLKRGSDSNYYETENYAVNEFTTPGSTFKLFSAMALLEDGFINNLDSIDNSWGSWNWHNSLPLTDSRKPDKRFYTLGECLQYSSNVGISKFVMKYYRKQPDNFVNHAIRMGLHVKPQFDISYGNKPNIPTPSDTIWSPTSLPSMSYGYSLLLSPLQILMLYNTVANKGVMMQPYMVQEIRQEGQIISKIEPKILNKKAIKLKTTQMLTQMLIQVVENGTAKNIRTDIYSIAGKTGTAWIYNNKLGYKDAKRFQASFAGFFPANNPQYTIVVVVSNPRKNEHTGGTIAAPIFKTISDRIYSSHIKNQAVSQTRNTPQIPGILPGHYDKTKWVLHTLGIASSLDLSQEKFSPGKRYVESKKDSMSILLRPVSITKNGIPDLRGMGLRDAIAILDDMGIRAQYTGYGRVIKQSPEAKTPLGIHKEVLLSLSPF
ncbi:MAG: PASTA domain-containing protein [Flavobacteriaceae bacterium]|nr:PASTA domain-containing protein [Flavobacteriaceae bacterium]